MSDAALIIPLVLTAVAAVAAALCGWPAVNRRLNITQASWLLALLPLAAFVFFLSRLPAIANGTALTFSVDWMPSLGMTANLYYDSLSALFLLLVTGIGTPIIVYSGYYFKGDNSAWRFLAYMFLFMTAMVGVLLAGDVITLFVFWECTSITSFLLIAYKTKDEAARRGAFKSLFITGGGGVERLGYGIDRMIAAMAEAGLAEPVFEEMTAGFRVSLRSRGDELVSKEPANQRWSNRRLNPRQERAVAYLAERGTITNREFRELCPELSDETIRRELSDMVDQGLIMKVGDRKATYYILK